MSVDGGTSFEFSVNIVAVEHAKSCRNQDIHNGSLRFAQLSSYIKGMLELRPTPKVITFDCYGTLVQWREYMRHAVRDILLGRYEKGDVEHQVVSIADRIRELAGVLQQQSPFRDYHEVLMTSLLQALSEVGLPSIEADYDMLRAVLGRIPPHPEVPAALARLSNSYRLAIISNTADDLIAGTVEAIGTPVDFVITAEQARSYKPDHHLFHHAYATIGVAKEETVHVAMGQFTDLKVCRELGIRSVWIDRLGEPLNPAWTPDAVLPDLAGLAGLLNG